ncbi:polyadenylate-binding protein RBP47-like, partial [Trifolium medium]|nr:polyadenylate-binding protein RBP47-like [Trifolium medium]
WRNDSNGHYGGQGYGGHGYGGGHGYAARQNQDIAMQPAAAVQGAS